MTTGKFNCVSEKDHEATWIQREFPPRVRNARRCRSGEAQIFSFLGDFNVENGDVNKREAVAGAGV